MTDPGQIGYPRHGGDIALASARYGIPVDGWLDLSTGVNPHAYPAQPFQAVGLSHLPNRGDLDRLLAAARAAYRVPAGVALIATPGTEIAIRLLPLAVSPGEVSILSPTYSSHIEAWRAAGKVVLVGDLGRVPPTAAIVVLGNPNNPDGRSTEPASLIALAEHVRARSGLLVVDEAFADLTPSMSLIPHLHGLWSVVLRSFGKFFGLPGLRLGFLAGADEPVARVAALLGDWPVSTAAIAIGTAALADEAWQATMRSRLGEEAERLRALLSRHRLRISGGTDLFLLVEAEDALQLHVSLARRGIRTRVFQDEARWLRLGLPGDDGDFERLDRALRDR